MAKLPLPSDVDVENSLIATICAPGAEHALAQATITLTPDDFIDPLNQTIFKAASLLSEQRSEVHAVSIKSALNDATWGKLGGFTAICDRLACEEVRKPMVLVETIKRKKLHRDLMKVGHELMTKSAHEEANPEALIEETTSRLSKMLLGSDKGNLVSLESFGTDLVADMAEKMQGKTSKGIMTGFHRLDSMTQGFKPGQFIVLAARPGVGKSALAVSWMLGAAKMKHSSAYFSLEMSKDELWKRSVGIEAGINMREAGRVYDPSVLAKIAAANETLSSLPISIGDRATITVREIVSQVDQYITRHGKIDFILVDYLQLITTPEGKSQKNETNRIADISRAFKLLAKDHGIPVVVLSQLNREVEKRNDGKPRLSDLRDSGAIEQDADIVCFIHRKANANGELENGGELIVAKHRGGPCGVIPMLYTPELTRFDECSRETELRLTSPIPQEEMF
jgi:replicative DNA helicase